MKFKKNIKSAFLVSIAMFIICGLFYPLVMTGLSQLIFPHQSNGSLVEYEGKIVGSKIIGQDFTDNKLFHSRPSAVNYNTYTDKSKYSGIASGSENLAVSNPKLKERIEKDIDTFLKENPTVTKKDIPEDMITASGSGLDPHISEKSAYIQADRVAKANNLSKETVDKLIMENTSDKLLGVFGEKTVNVLELNLSLIKQAKK